MSDAADALGAGPTDTTPSVNEADDTGQTFATPDAYVPHLCPDGRLAIPWLLVRGMGEHLEDVAREISAAALRGGVRIVDGTISDYPENLRPSGFPGLVLALHTAPSGRGLHQKRWAGFHKLVNEFRAQTIPLEQALKTGLWHRAGVLQVLYPDSVLDDEGARQLINMACDSHQFTPGIPFTGDLFSIYRPGAFTRRQKDQVALAAEKHWRLLQSFGITDRERAEAVKIEIEKARQLYNDPAKKVLHKPLADFELVEGPERELNQLDLVLFHPGAKPILPPGTPQDQAEKEEDKFTANGARVVRETNNAIRDKYEWFHQPVGREGKRDAQALFRNLYQTLRIALGGS